MNSGAATVNTVAVAGKKFLPEQLTEIQKALESATRYKSQNKLAVDIGVNAATLTNVKQGNWTQLSNEMIATLRAYFKLDDWKLRNTDNYIRTTKLMMDARNNRRMMALAGYTGGGKTVAGTRFCMNEGGHYVLATSVMTQRGFATAILRSMGLEDEGNLEEKISKIANALKRSETPLLVIDDCGKLKDACLQLIQIIYDLTEHSAGIVLLGTEFLKKTIDKKAAKDVLGFRELKRRISYWMSLSRPSAGIIKEICLDYGINNTHAIKFIETNANDFGTLRNLIVNAKIASEQQGAAITRDFLVTLDVGSLKYEG
jgi:DNA transposition AAA+ family ATPase